MEKKYFTLDEANKLLPTIGQDLIYLQQTKRLFELKVVELKQKKEASLPAEREEDPFFALELELEFMQIEANGMIKNFSLKGVELKDIDHGLVDFPALLDGREVLLCWRQGEGKITHYHGINEGFNGRKPLH